MEVVCNKSALLCCKLLKKSINQQQSDERNTFLIAIKLRAKRKFIYSYLYIYLNTHFFVVRTLYFAIILVISLTV